MAGRFWAVVVGTIVVDMKPLPRNCSTTRRRFSFSCFFFEQKKNTSGLNFHSGNSNLEQFSTGALQDCRGLVVLHQTIEGHVLEAGHHGLLQSLGLLLTRGRLGKVTEQLASVILSLGERS